MSKIVPGCIALVTRASEPWTPCVGTEVEVGQIVPEEELELDCRGGHPFFSVDSELVRALCREHSPLGVAVSHTALMRIDGYEEEEQGITNYRVNCS